MEKKRIDVFARRLSWDIETGHNVLSTVHVECESMYNPDVAEEFAPVGETEFIQGLATMNSSDGVGNCK